MRLRIPTQLRAPGRVLGLAFGPQSISVAEAAGRNGSPVRAAEYPLPRDLVLEDPEALGRGLGEFLRREGFSARRAVAGVPARWLVARARRLPPLSAALAPGAVRIQAERELSLDLDDLALDFAGEPDPSEPRPILLLALERRRLDGIARACRAAGLRLLAVAPSTLAASLLARDALRDGLLVSLAAGSAELLLQRDGRPVSLQAVAWNGTKPAEAGDAAGASAPPDAERGLARLAAEIRRFLALAPGGTAERGLILDGVGLGPGAPASLGERAGLALEPCDLPAPAAALALSGARRELLAVDFLRPRCAPPKARRVTRRTLAIAACAAAIAGAVAYALVDTERREASLAELKDRLLRMAPDVEEADAFVKNNKRLILGWYDARPRPLEILKRVTLAFPERGTVWATSLTLSESGKGTLSGKAADQKSVLAVLDRLKGDPAFTEVMLSDMREASTGGGGVSFALTFSFQSTE